MSDETQVQRLRGLLLANATSALARKCLEASRDEASFNYISTRPLPFAQVRQIYARRAALNKKRHGAVEGFDELLAAFESETGQTAVVHLLEAAGGTFTLITDESTQRLIGILSSEGKELDSADDGTSPPQL